MLLSIQESNRNIVVKWNHNGQFDSKIIIYI
jgi:hypothetical protein